MIRRNSKYGNVPTVVDGIRFDSKREAKRWGELCLMEKAAVIKDLRRQVPYTLAVGGETVCRYVADFVYLEDGRLIVEDAKGWATPEYRLKKKLMRIIHGIEIKET